MQIHTCLMCIHYHLVTWNSFTALKTPSSLGHAKPLATTDPVAVAMDLPFSRLSYNCKFNSLSNSTPRTNSKASRPVAEGQEISSAKQRGPRPPLFQLSSLCSPRSLDGDQPLGLARMAPLSALNVLKVPGKSFSLNMV